MRKVLCIFLAAALLLSLTGCVAMGSIAGNVADAAAKELEQQLKSTLEKNKLELVEMKTAFGELNDQGGKLQFFCAALVKAENEEALEVCRKVLGSVFDETGIAPQSAPEFSNARLVHKTITFDHGDFSQGNYYVVYGYMGALLGGGGQSTTQATE